MGLGPADPALAVDSPKLPHGLGCPKPQPAITAPGSLLRRCPLEDYVLILGGERGLPVDGVAAVKPGAGGNHGPILGQHNPCLGVFQLQLDGRDGLRGGNGSRANYGRLAVRLIGAVLGELPIIHAVEKLPREPQAPVPRMIGRGKGSHHRPAGQAQGMDVRVTFLGGEVAGVDYLLACTEGETVPLRLPAVRGSIRPSRHDGYEAQCGNDCESSSIQHGFLPPQYDPGNVLFFPGRFTGLSSRHGARLVSPIIVPANHSRKTRASGKAVPRIGSTTCVLVFCLRFLSRSRCQRKPT